MSKLKRHLIRKYVETAPENNTEDMHSDTPETKDRRTRSRRTPRHARAAGQKRKQEQTQAELPLDDKVNSVVEAQPEDEAAPIEPVFNAELNTAVAISSEEETASEPMAVTEPETVVEPVIVAEVETTKDLALPIKARASHPTALPKALEREFGEIVINILNDASRPSISRTIRQATIASVANRAQAPMTKPTSIDES